jgi:hypothetical protein
MIETDPNNQEPFNVRTDAPVISGSEHDYFDFINNNYFNILKQRKVLEIGPCYGQHSKLIVDHGPSYFEIIEGDKTACRKVKKIQGISNIIHDDVMQNLISPRPFDVVICFGVLYHLHSPLHLLELIVNYCDPEYILLDSCMEPEELAFKYEMPDIAGNAQIRDGWKSCSKNLVLPFLIYLDVMENLGYTLDLVHRLRIKNYPAKADSWVARWKKQ